MNQPIRKTNPETHIHRTPISKSQIRRIHKNTSTVIAILFVVLVGIVIGVFTAFQHGDLAVNVSTQAKYAFMKDLNARESDAIELYRTEYIAYDDYIFDGPLTIELMAEKYNLNSKELWSVYQASGIDSAQEFYSKYVIPKITTLEYEKGIEA